MTGLAEGVTARDLVSVAAEIGRAALSAQEAVSACLARIHSLNPSLNAYINVFSDRALAKARHADEVRARGEILGPLHGVPLGIKDVFEAEGQVMTAGMPSRVNARATTTATVVRRLEAAGAIILGTQNVAEGIFGEYVPPFGAPLNPWAADRWPGASSGGSAVAVAAQLCFGAIASDTGGSIRMPSAVNGTTGLKPTWGRVSRAGVFELAATLDHIGPIARSAADAALLFDVIAGPDAADPTSMDETPPRLSGALSGTVAGLSIGLDPRWIEVGVDAEISKAVMSCASELQRLGARLVQVELPALPDVVDIWYDVCAAQTALVHQAHFAAHSSSYSSALAGIIGHGINMSATTLQRAQARRNDYAGRLNRALAVVDLVAIPVLPFEPPRLAQTAVMDRAMIDALHRFTCPFTLSGAPCITFPGGFTLNGLPLAVQLVARPRAESVLLSAAHAFQGVTDFHLRRPFAASVTLGRA